MKTAKEFSELMRKNREEVKAERLSRQWADIERRVDSAYEEVTKGKAVYQIVLAGEPAPENKRKLEELGFKVKYDNGRYLAVIPEA